MGTPSEPTERPSEDELVRHVARLARLALTVDEQQVLGRQLGDILRYVEQLAELDTTGVEPTAFAGPEGASRGPGLRIDLTTDEKLGNAPDREGDAFRVPRVI